MKYHSVRHILIAVAIVMLLLGALTGATVSAQEMETVYVSSPTEGQVVSDLVMVTGAADFLDFLKFEVFIQGGGNMLWVATVHSPVINGNLAHMDTKIYPDGTYRLVIRKVTTDSNYTDFFGPTFTIENNLGAPLPHPDVIASPLYPPPISSGALFRIKNCSGKDLEFDYQSPGSFCSADNLWIMPKEQDSLTCPYVDALVEAPCEYRGTAMGTGEPRAVNYSLETEPGKIYQFDFAGGVQLYFGEVAGDERASTDTGHLDLDDPARIQTLEDVQAAADISMAEEAVTEEVASTEVSVEVEEEATTEDAAVSTPVEPEEDTTEAPATSTETTNEVLPESGQEARSKTPFAIAAVGVILFLVAGGVLATRRGKQATS